MNENVREFILSNKNERVKWKIDGCFFYNIDAIPNDLQEKQVFGWMVNLWDGFIEISTINKNIEEN